MSTQNTMNRINAYFSKRYPTRSSIFGRLLFRHGESARIRIVSQWYPSMQGISIIDIGCGDGKFLSSVISGYPKKIVLEDISNSAILKAYENLKGKADIIEKHVCNSLMEESGNFDLVLAIGIFDYYSNWKYLIRKLILRSRDCVIISFPRNDHLRNWLRFIWFFIHGIKLQILNRERFTQAISTLGLPFEIKCTHFEWFVRIFTNNGLK